MLSKQLIPFGAFFSRPYGEWASDVYGLCSAYKKIVKEFKAVVDPDNIMNPGKLNL
jgi:FAD/FMN-containing dehydrogenase